MTPRHTHWSRLCLYTWSMDEGFTKDATLVTCPECLEDMAEEVEEELQGCISAWHDIKDIARTEGVECPMCGER